MIRPAKKVPSLYQREWEHKQAMFIQRRIWFAGATLLATFFLSQLLNVWFSSGRFEWMDRFPYWAVFAAGILLILCLNFRARTLKPVKAVAALLPIFFLIFSTIRFIHQPQDGVFTLSSVLILSLFTICLIIPWSVSNVVWLVLLHITAYIAYYYLLPIEQAIHYFQQRPFVEGFAYLVLTGALCAVVRYSDYRRDVEVFLLIKENAKKSLEIEKKGIEIEKKNDQMRKELEFASQVHRSLVPQSITTPKVDIHVTYLPMSGVGGDYAEFHFLDEDRLIFIISDVTGHGVPAALLVNRLHAEFRHLCEECGTPGLLLKKLNDFILRDFAGTGMYLSAFCGLLDLRDRKLLYSNYGHPPQYLFRVKKSDVEFLGAQTSLLGVRLENDDAVHESQMELWHGDRLLLFTDGVVETVNKRGEEYGGARLERFLHTHQELSNEDWNRRLVEDLNLHRHGEFHDDIFIMNIRIK